MCGDLLKVDRYVCEDCSYLISEVKTPCCLKCGCEINDEETEYCDDCARKEKSYVKGFPALNYFGDIRDSVAAFKYHGKKWYADFFADEIIKRHGEAIMDIAPEVLIPVPVHKKKLKLRGYNQAELLANALSVRMSIPTDNEILFRNTNTTPQKILGSSAREMNLKKAFNSTDKIVKYNKVMLVDDIYTTGATIEACTKALNEKGVREVFYTSICIGKGY